MTPYFHNQERIAALIAAAASWAGTPFAANSASRGRGVSCQFLASELYRGAGLSTAEPPAVPMAHARFSRVSLVEPWMDAQENFGPIPLGEAPIPGDLLGFRLWETVHHVGVLIHPGQFLNVVEGARAALVPLADPTWASRLARVWRPYE